MAVGAAAVPAALMLFMMLRLPESPRWMAKTGNVDGARTALERVRPHGSDVKPELDEVREAVRAEE